MGGGAFGPLPPSSMPMPLAIPMHWLYLVNERENVLGTVEGGNVVEVVWIEEEVVQDLKLGRLEEHRALVVRKRPVVVDCVVHVALVYRYLSTDNHASLQRHPTFHRKQRRAQLWADRAADPH